MRRADLLDRLASETFDLLVIGGGASGAGVALEAASRGLKTALVERYDFAEGTSSRSTKLIHGGVRYLELAIKTLDRVQLNLVRDALHERAVLLRIAPHLSRPLWLLTPLYRLWEVPYYYAGLKIYDLLAGSARLAPAQFIGARGTLERFPHLNPRGLKGAVAYQDGQFDDARFNVELALTALQQGGVVLNQAEVTGLLKENHRLRGAVVHDRLSGKTLEVFARVVVNATGPFADGIRQMDDPHAPPLLRASSGIHIMLDSDYTPPETGLLIPKTEDGRVVFVLPWLGGTLVGTTDDPAPIVDHPRVREEEIAPGEGALELVGAAPAGCPAQGRYRPAGPRPPDPGKPLWPAHSGRGQVDHLPQNGPGPGELCHPALRVGGRPLPKRVPAFVGGAGLHPGWGPKAHSARPGS